jgi:hypothetical protein
MDTNEPELIPQGELDSATVKNMERMIERFKKEFDKRCNWEDAPRPVDTSDKERDKVIISTLGLCMKHLINDNAMLKQAKAIPELESLAETAEEFKKNLEA